MNKEPCKLHFGGNATPCGRKSCKTCIPFLAFKITIILLSGMIIGAAGLLLVEGNPAAELLRGSADRNNQRIAVIEKLQDIDRSMIAIKQDVIIIKRRMGGY